MERMTHERANGIKTGYWSPATKEELVQRLAAYENTDLEPWEIGPAIEKAAKDAESATAAKMAECIAGGIKDGQTDEYLLRDERMEETPDWMRDFPKQTPDADTERAVITLGYDGRQILFYRLPDGGVLPVNEEYLAPIDSEREFAVRMVAGVPALAIKEGMYIAAVIAKYDAFGEKDGIKLPELRAALSREKGIWR